MVAEPVGHSRRARSQGTRMNRTFLLVSGVICWTVVAIDAAVHVLDGDMLVPTAMAVVFVAWVGLRQMQVHRRERQTA